MHARTTRRQSQNREHKQTLQSTTIYIAQDARHNSHDTRQTQDRIHTTSYLPITYSTVAILAQFLVCVRLSIRPSVACRDDADGSCCVFRTAHQVRGGAGTVYASRGHSQGPSPFVDSHQVAQTVEGRSRRRPCLLGGGILPFLAGRQAGDREGCQRYDGRPDDSRDESDNQDAATPLPPPLFAREAVGVPRVGGHEGQQVPTVGAVHVPIVGLEEP